MLRVVELRALVYVRRCAFNYHKFIDFDSIEREVVGGNVALRVLLLDFVFQVGHPSVLFNVDWEGRMVAGYEADYPHLSVVDGFK